MVKRLCLVSLTISNRKTSYRSLKQIAGSTSCPWTTTLVITVLWHGDNKMIFTATSFEYCTPSIIFQSVPILVILQVVKLNSVITICTAQSQVLGVTKVIYWMVYTVLNVMQMNSGQMMYQLVDKLVRYFLLWGRERIAGTVSFTVLWKRCSV